MFLIKHSEKDYEIKTKTYSLAGSINLIVEHAIERLGVPLDQVNEALATMQLNGHNRANFGIQGYFIYSDSVEDTGRACVVLKAISDVRKELDHKLVTQGSLDVTDKARLINLYSGLDVDAVLRVLSNKGA